MSAVIRDLASSESINPGQDLAQGKRYLGLPFSWMSVKETHVIHLVMEYQSIMSDISFYYDIMAVGFISSDTVANPPPKMCLSQ